MPSFVDSHCHLTLLPPSISIDEALAHARTEQVGHMLCVAIDLLSFPALLQLAKTHQDVSCSVGVHPNTESTDERLLSQLLELGAEPEVVAIGETGLDYFRSTGDLAWQRQRFRTHIQAAKTLGKPLIIHTREAKEEVLDILQAEQAQEVGGVMHCFVEDIETAQAAMAMGFYISFSGIITFKNAKALQEVVRQLPLEKMLIETDSPYLAPVPYRGKTNQPAYVRYIAEHIAQLKDLTAEEVGRVTGQNFFKLFFNK